MLNEYVNSADRKYEEIFSIVLIVGRISQTCPDYGQHTFQVTTNYRMPNLA